MYGENGVTYKIFSKIFLWTYGEKKLLRILFKSAGIKQNIDKIQNMYMFWNFGKNAQQKSVSCFGEPDVIITTKKYIFIVEVELLSIVKRIKSKNDANLLKQLRRFYMLGRFFEEKLDNEVNARKITPGKSAKVVMSGYKIGAALIPLQKYLKDFTGKKFYLISITKDSEKEVDVAKKILVSKIKDSNPDKIVVLPISKLGKFQIAEEYKFTVFKRIRARPC